MSDNIKLSPINQKNIQNQKTSQNSLNADLKKSDNRLKQDTFIKRHKNAITFGSIVGGIGLAIGATFLAYKGIFGSKLQGFIGGIVNKFSNNTSNVSPKTTSSVPTNKTSPIVSNKPIDNTIEITSKPVQEAVEEVTNVTNKGDIEQPVAIKPTIQSPEVVKPNKAVPTTPIETQDKVTSIKSEPETITQKSAKIGTYQNPIIEETKDIALGEEKCLKQILSKDKDGNVHINNLMMDVDKSWSIPTQGSDGPIMEAYEDKDLLYTLREMQFNGGKIPDKEISRLRKKYNRTDWVGDEIRQKFSSEEEYIQKSIQKIYDNLAQQTKSLKELAPSKQDCVLYRGVDLSFSEDNFLHRNDFINLLNSLKEGDKTILDWGAMCTTGDIGLATQYSTDNVLRIKTPKGSRLMRATVETRFPSKSEFIFKGKNSYNGLTFWDFEYVTPEI